ncbi:hypothetical protein ACFXTO_003817 [Malus domestica]
MQSRFKLKLLNIFYPYSAPAGPETYQTRSKKPCACLRTNKTCMLPSHGLSSCRIDSFLPFADPNAPF